MILLDQMQNLKVYKVPMLMPTLEKDKKNHSAMLFLTPNYDSTKKLMNHKLLVNRLRYQSYYMESDVSYYITGKNANKKISNECYFSNASENDLIDNKFVNESAEHPSSRVLEDFIYYNGYQNDIANLQEAFNHIEYMRILSELKDTAIMKADDIPIVQLIADRDCPVDEVGYCFDFDGINEVAVILNPEISDSNMKSAIGEAIFSQIIPVSRNSLFGGIFAETVYGGHYYNNIGNVHNMLQYIVKEDIDNAAKAINIRKEDIYNIDHHKLEDGDHNFTYYGVNTTLREAKNVLSENSLSTHRINLDSLSEDSYIITDGKTAILFESANDNYLRKILYNERIRRRNDLLAMLKTVKKENSFIKYAYPDMSMYKGKNLMVDLHYYTEIFFKNSMWRGLKGFNLFLDFMDRLINDPRYKANGYTKKTLIIPIEDWTNNPDTRMWIYKQSINPVSIIYQLMITHNAKLDKVFANTNILFISNNYLLKLDLHAIDPKTLKPSAIRLARLIHKILTNEDFESDELDQESIDNKKETKEVIRANIMDKIELSKGVDLTGKQDILGYIIAADKSNRQIKNLTTKTSEIIKKDKKEFEVEYLDALNNPADVPSPIKQLTTDEKQAAADNGTPKSLASDDKKDNAKNYDQMKIAKQIDDIASHDDVKNTDDALKAMDSDDNLKLMISDLSIDGTESTNPARAARMNDLDKKFLYSEIDGKTVEDILKENPSDKPLEKTEIKIDSPNKEWNNLTYMNFDKTYDLNRDIVACFYHFTKVSHPIAIRNLTVTDNTTSEDRLDLYTCQCEDAFGQRFTLKLDIPKEKDNRFLLRGNDKAIKTQLFNMPILKTDLDTCQCISNYQKIMISRYNTSSGRTFPTAGKIIKGLSKYTKNDVKIIPGDNSRICNRYELPIDYIDIASSYDIIEGSTYKIYFNQDNIHADYPNIDDNLGVAYAYDKLNKTIIYYSQRGYDTFSDQLLALLQDRSPELAKVIEGTKPTASGAYTRCSIMSAKIPMVIICGLLVGLTETLKRAKIDFNIYQTKSRPTTKPNFSVIRFSDGYLEYQDSYDSCLLMNGLKDGNPEIYSVTDIDNRNMYLEMLDDFGGRIKAGGLYNFYDCFVDPITYENLKHYHLPTNFIDILLYSNALLADNKFVKHTDMSSRRIRRKEMIAAYTYETLGLAYGDYANQIRKHVSNPEFIVKQSAVIDKFLASDISSDSSILTALSAIETTNEITFKGKSGLNNSESYSLDKRIYDDSMENVLAASTNFSANAGINRVSTIDMNIEGERGYIKVIDGDTSKYNDAKTLSATEAITPFGTTHDDSTRVNMTYIQTAKHMMRTDKSDPLLVTNGFDQVMPYMTSDKFAYKAKQDGVVEKVNDSMMLIRYKDGTADYVNLTNKVEKNSDGGFYVNLKLDADDKIKEGTKIKKDQVVAYDKKSFSKNTVGESDKLTYDIGTLAKVAIINADTNYEDSGTCSESLSRKLATTVVKKISMIISKDATILKFCTKGSTVKVNDPLVIWSDPHNEEDVDALSRTLGSEADLITEFGRRSLRSNVTGTIEDIRLYRTTEISDMSSSVQKIFRNYEKPITELKKELEANKIDTSELPANYKLDTTGKLKKARDSFLVEFFVGFLDTVAVGDKITYFSANKAVIDSIIPEDKTPYTDFRPKEPIDAMMSVTSCNKRMVNSILIYGALQKLLIELDRSCKDLLDIPYDETQA